MEVLFQPTVAYKNFTSDHYLPILFISLFFLLAIAMTRQVSDKKKYHIAFILSLIPLLAVIARMLCTSYEGIFTVQEELPLHLCRLVALILPIVIWYRNTKWINTLYYLVMVGTLQAIITADLQYTVPHYSYFLYFTFHVSLVWVSVFIIWRLRLFPTRRDMVRAFVFCNIYMICTLIINFSIGSNYFYTRQKPVAGSLLDLFGPWPWYIVVAESLAVILFILAYLPFYKKENRLSTF